MADVLGKKWTALTVMEETHRMRAATSDPRRRIQHITITTMSIHITTIITVTKPRAHLRRSQWLGRHQTLYLRPTSRQARRTTITTTTPIQLATITTTPLARSLHLVCHQPQSSAERC
jgi:hypothetical protein